MKLIRKFFVFSVGAGLVFYTLSSLVTFHAAKLPLDMQELQIGASPSFLCVNSFGVPFNATTWENHCLPDNQIIYQQIANLLIWIFGTFFFFVTVNFKKLNNL